MFVSGWLGRPDRNPTHLAASDVEADLEAEGVAVEREGFFRVVEREHAGVNGDVHGAHARCRSTAGASRFLIGLVTCFSTHDGIPSVTRGCLFPISARRHPDEFGEAGAERAK